MGKSNNCRKQNESNQPNTTLNNKTMEEYFIKFYSTVQYDEYTTYKAGEMKRVSEAEMFKLIEKAVNEEDVEFVIYKTKIICDLS